MLVDTTRAPYRKKWEYGSQQLNWNYKLGLYDCLKRWVFRRCLSSSRVGALRTLSGRGRLFQEAGPATANARLPSSRRVRRTNRMYHMVCLFSAQLLLVLIVPIYGGMARPSGWYHTEMVYLPIQVPTRPDVWSNFVVKTNMFPQSQTATSNINSHFLHGILQCVKQQRQSITRNY